MADSRDPLRNGAIFRVRDLSVLRGARVGPSRPSAVSVSGNTDNRASPSDSLPSLIRSRFEELYRATPVPTFGPFQAMLTSRSTTEDLSTAVFPSPVSIRGKPKNGYEVQTSYPGNINEEKSISGGHQSPFAPVSSPSNGQHELQGKDEALASPMPSLPPPSKYNETDLPGPGHLPSPQRSPESNHRLERPSPAPVSGRRSRSRLQTSSLLSLDKPRNDSSPVPTQLEPINAGLLPSSSSHGQPATAQKAGMSKRSRSDSVDESSIVGVGDSQRKKSLGSNGAYKISEKTSNSKHRDSAKKRRGKSESAVLGK